MKIQTKASVVGALSAAIVVGTVAIAGNITFPNTFTAGTPIRAAEVNANFQAVKTASDDNQAQITALQTAPILKVIDTGANDVIFLAGGAVNNFLTLTLTAPRAGYVQLTASGNCTLPTGSAASSDTSIYFASSATAFPGALLDKVELWWAAAGTNNSVFWPWSLVKVAPVTAGSNTFYVNGQSTGAGALAGLGCRARLSAVFSPGLLP